MIEIWRRIPWNKMIDWEKVKKNAGRTIYFNEELFIYEDKCWILEILKYCKKVLCLIFIAIITI